MQTIRDNYLYHGLFCLRLRYTQKSNSGCWALLKKSRPLLWLCIAVGVGYLYLQVPIYQTFGLILPCSIPVSWLHCLSCAGLNVTPFTGTHVCIWYTVITIIRLSWWKTEGRLQMEVMTHHFVSFPLQHMLLVISTQGSAKHVVQRILWV